MSSTFPEQYRDLVDRPIVATLATTLPDGTPQATPIWFDYQNGLIMFNTAVGRLKDRAVRMHPYVAVMVLDPNNGYRYVQFRGPVIEIDETNGRAGINALCKRYTGADIYTFGPPDEPRVTFWMRPEHIYAQG
ncbi:MAG: PPOX class F420-dependent oxidoreductase [Roseiflexaceae bacterium]